MRAKLCLALAQLLRQYGLEGKGPAVAVRVLQPHGRAAVHGKGGGKLLLVVRIHLLQHTRHDGLESRCRRMSVLLAESHELRALDIEVVTRHLGTLIHKGILVGFVYLQGLRHVEDILVLGHGFGNEARRDLIELVSQVIEHPLTHRAVVEPDAGRIILLAVLEGEVVVHQRIIDPVAAHAVGKSVEVGNPDFVLDVGDTEHTPFGKSAANIGRAIHLYRLETRTCVFIGDIRSIDVQYKINPGMNLDRLVNGFLQDFSIDILIQLDVLGVAGVKEVKIQPCTVADWGLFHL